MLVGKNEVKDSKAKKSKFSSYRLASLSLLTISSGISRSSLSERLELIQIWESSKLYYKI